MTWYIDGVAVPATTHGSWATANLKTPQTSCIGAKAGVAGQELIGSIDDLAMWSRTLSAGEVSFIYSNGKQLSNIMDVKLGVDDWSLM